MPTVKTGIGKVRVLVVDDSAAVRTTLANILAGDRDIEVMGTAADPYSAAEKIRQSVPDVIFLDIEMPKMDGLTFLRKLMAQHPIPVVICSGLTGEGSDELMQAFAIGAVDVITKPRVDTAAFLNESAMLIRDVAKAASQARIPKASGRLPPPVKQLVSRPVEAKLLADVIIPPLSPSRIAQVKAGIPLTEPVICLGSSTGGTEALAEILTALPAGSPGVLVVQHMPENFTAAFARRLDGLCAMRVSEARDGDVVRRGEVFIAPGNRHMLLKRSGNRYSLRVIDGQHVCRHRPSVDVLFRSAAQTAGPNLVAALLTGMGDDGARGLLEIHTMGGATIAQDEATSIVFGMPREAIERGAAQRVLPLGKIADALIASSSHSGGREIA